MSTEANFEKLLKNFKEITGIRDSNICLEYLVSHKWDFSSAVIDAMEKLSDHSQSITGNIKANVNKVQTTVIRIRCGDCSLQKKFFLDDNLDTLFRYCEENGFGNCTYELIPTVPDNVLEPSDKDKTFRQLNFSHQEEVIACKQIESHQEEVIACKLQTENYEVVEDDSDEDFGSVDGILNEVSVSSPTEPIPKVSQRNRAIIWYKRVNETFDWKIVTSYAAQLEKSYLQFMSGKRQHVLELYFDDYQDYVFVDFTKMIVTTSKSKDIVLCYLRRKDMLDGIPRTWSWDGTSLAEYHLIELPSDSTEYLQVANAVNQTSGGAIIQKIERVENPVKYKQYLLLKQKLEVLHAGQHGFIIERQLYHGTDEGNIPSICSNGFNRTLCGQHGTLWGAGSYFATTFLYSSYFGNKKVFYANVLTGTFTKGNWWMKLAPDFDKSRGIQYDSVVDDVTNPNIFVVFSDNHAYPSYLITYAWSQNMVDAFNRLFRSSSCCLL